MVRGITPPAQLIAPRRLTTPRRERRLTAPQRVRERQPEPTTPAPKTAVPVGFTDLPIAEAIAILFPTVPSRRRRARPIDLSGRMLYLQSLGFAPIKLAGYFKDEGGARGKGETGYVLSKLLKSSEVPSELKSWYDSQVAIMQKELEEAKKRVDRNITKLKASGKDYERTDIIRIYKNAYPKWSEQYKRKAKEYVRKKAYEERIAAWKAARGVGVPSVGETIVLKGFDIPRELRTAGSEEQEDLGVKKVDGEWVQEVIVLGGGQQVPKVVYDSWKMKQQEAVLAAAKAGIGVGLGAGVVIIPGYEQPPIITIEATAEERQKAEDAKADADARGAVCYTTIQTFKVKLRDGTIILVETLDSPYKSGVESARGKAEGAGHQVAWVTKRMPGDIIKPSIKETGVYNAIKEDGTVDIMVPFNDPETDQRLLISSDVADDLKDSEAYDGAKGSEEDRLGVAYAVQQKDFELQLRSKFPSLYTVYKDEGVEAYNEALLAEREDFIGELQEQDPALHDIYTSGGWDALSEAIDKQNEEYAGFQAKIKSGEILALPDGTYITKSECDKLPQGTQQILREGGFAKLEAVTELRWDKVDKPVGVSWDPIYQKRLEKWESLPESITQKEMRDISFLDKEFYRIAPGYEKRAWTLLAVPFVPPAKAALPEYAMADVSATDWLLAGANIALLPIAFAPGASLAAVAAATRSVHVGRVVGTVASGIISGVVGYETARNWDELSNVQRGIGVGIAALCAIPILTTVARNVKIAGSPNIPTVKGDVVAWKGLSVAGHPIIGRSGGKWVLGTRNLTVPEANLILNGYHPQMMLETKVFVNRGALTKAGFTRTQVDYLVKTLKARNLFAGKMSPWLDKSVLIEPTQRLTSREINIIMRHIADKSKQVKNAKYLYGSPTMKAQAAPELRNWRPIHDWDISVLGSQDKVDDFVRALFDDLRVNGGGKYRISPDHPMLIEKQIKGKWVHIADIHPYDISSADIPASKLDTTGQYSYGRMVTEPAITVDYPGVGKIQIMRLSESGVRKADTILRVRQTLQGTAFRPPARGIAQPGVPKDAADFYVTLRTFTGRAVAEDWLAAWAKAMGYTDDQLATVLPRIRKAMLEVASQTPSDIIGYEFIPAKIARVSAGASPSIVVHIPSSLGASVSPSLAKIISQPIYPYKQARSPSAGIYASTALYSVMSKAPSGYLASPSASPVLSIISRGVPSPSPMPSPYPSPKINPLPSVLGAPSPTPSPVPSPSPVPVPTPMPTPEPAPTLRLVTVKGEKRYKLPKGSWAWRQGFVWKFVPPPWNQDKPITLDHPPMGATNLGEKTPEKTIQMIGKPKAKVPKDASIDLGVVDIKISNYGKRIDFVGKGLETVAGHSIASTTKGMSVPAKGSIEVSGYAKLAFGTDLRSLVNETYQKKIPKKFADKVLGQKLGKMSAKAIAAEIKETKVSPSRRTEILKMLPDRVRREVELWETMVDDYAPTRGMPPVKAVPTIFRRKKQKEKAVVKSASVG